MKPEAEPKITKTISAETTVTREQAEKIWEFLRANGKDQREEIMETVQFQLSQFLKSNSDWDFSDEALLLLSDLQIRRGEHKAAVMTILQLIYEYPDSKSVFPAKRTLAELLDKKIDKKVKQVLSEAARGSDAREKSERLAHLLKKLSEQTGDLLYEPLVAGFDLFFNRFPSYSGSDELSLLFGDLLTKKGKHLSALTYYRKLLALYPESDFRARAQRSIGDLFVNHLKDVNEAVNAYQEVINQYPKSEEAGYAYEQTARLEEQFKHYDLSVELYDKIIALYPNKEIAMRAFNNEARILRDLMDSSAEAIKAYGRLADMFKGSEGAAEALKAAAATARKKKDYDTEVSMYQRFVKECSTNKEAPEVLYQAAEVTEEDLARHDKAVELYGEVAEKFPESKSAKKAKSRIESLTKKK